MDTLLTCSALEFLALSDEALDGHVPDTEPARGQLLRRLLRRWHPDRNPDPHAPDVFHRVRALRPRPASVPLRSVREFATDDGRRFSLTAGRFENFELGEVGLAERHLFWWVRPEHRDLALAWPASFDFADAGMAREMAPYLPKLESRLHGPAGTLLVVDRPAGFVRLRSLLAQTGPLPPEHVAWVMSALHHFLCYLEHACWVHHALSTDTVWVDPVRHRVAVYGGWFYATRSGAPARAVPALTATTVPRSALTAPAAPSTDALLLAALGRELLGSRSGMAMAGPAPMRDAVRLPRGADAPSRYRAWHAALEKAFGPRRFVPFATPFSTTD